MILTDDMLSNCLQVLCGQLNAGKRLVEESVLQYVVESSDVVSETVYESRGGLSIDGSHRSADVEQILSRRLPAVAQIWVSPVLACFYKQTV